MLEAYQTRLVPVVAMSGGAAIVAWRCFCRSKPPDPPQSSTVVHVDVAQSTTHPDPDEDTTGHDDSPRRASHPGVDALMQAATMMKYLPGSGFPCSVIPQFKPGDTVCVLQSKKIKTARRATVKALQCPAGSQFEGRYEVEYSGGASYHCRPENMIACLSPTADDQPTKVRLDAAAAY
jgi:hypothetical protein